MFTPPVIIGIDPGTTRIGYALLTGSKQHPTILDYGIIDTSDHDDPVIKLAKIYDDLTDLILEHHPTIAMVESLYFATNAKTAIAVAEARGVILLALKKHNLDIKSITPLQVKQQLTGYGKATKKQVQQTITRFLKLDTIPTPDDAADALAIAYLGL